MCYLRFRYRTFNADGSAALTQIRYYRFSSSLTNDQARAQLQALAPSQLLAQTTAVEPTESGYHTVDRRSDITVTDLGAA